MKIPYDGPTGSGVLRTGPLKIGDDLTGVFIRGDEALSKADLLEWACRQHNIPDVEGTFMYDLIKLLRSCREQDRTDPGL